MAANTTTLLIYRWIVFLLAGGYCIYMTLTGDYSYTAGPFRFLTIWALFASFYSASRMIAHMEGRTEREHGVTASVVAVLNVMVVYLYWKLFFTDPALVRGGQENKWFVQYYVHGLGPLLQWIDALFLLGAFRLRWGPVLRGFLALGLIVLAFGLWCELVLEPFGDRPIGSVTDGLPYPFLNNLEQPERIIFFATNMVVACAVYLALCVFSWGLGRLFPRQAAL